MKIKLDDILEKIDEFDCEEEKLFKQKEVEYTFIENLVKARKERGLTQKELAERTGLNQQVISSFEKYDRKPTLPNIIKYLLGLGIDINDIFKK